MFMLMKIRPVMLYAKLAPNNGHIANGKWEKTDPRPICRYGGQRCFVYFRLALFRGKRVSALVRILQLNRIASLWLHLRQQTEQEMKKYCYWTHHSNAQIYLNANGKVSSELEQVSSVIVISNNYSTHSIRETSKKKVQGKAVTFVSTIVAVLGGSLQVAYVQHWAYKLNYKEIW